MRSSYLKGNDYCDSPKDEYFCKYKPVDALIASADQYIFPCYVYDKYGKFLRIEYPKLKVSRKWTSRY